MFLLQHQEPRQAPEWRVYCSRTPRGNVQVVPDRVEYLRTRYTRCDAAYRDHLSSRSESTRSAAGRGPTYFTRGLVCEPEGQCVGVEGV